MTQEFLAGKVLGSLRALRWVLLLGGLAGVGACATLQQIAALRQVEFAFDRVADVRLAGVSILDRKSYADLRFEEATRIAIAVGKGNVPLEFVVHVKAENPASNTVSARMLELDWTLFLDEQRILDGDLDREHTFPPGQAVDVPIAVEFDAYDLYERDAENLFELALAIAGMEGYRKELRLDLSPTIQTELGAMRYPQPIVVRRTAGG